VAKAAIWPSWSPSGTRLAFAGGTSGTDVGYIGVVSAAGGVPRTIVRPGFRVVGAPAWSPGGRSIAFVAGLAAGAQSIYRVDPDHGSPRRLVTRRGGVGAVAWSPDGRRLAYAFDADGRGRTSIWVLRSDGSHRRVVAHVEGRAVVDTLAWSRAGRLVFAVP